MKYWRTINQKNFFIKWKVASKNKYKLGYISLVLLPARNFLAKLKFHFNLKYRNAKLVTNWDTHINSVVLAINY